MVSSQIDSKASLDPTGRHGSHYGMSAVVWEFASSGLKIPTEVLSHRLALRWQLAAPIRIFIQT
jgi:hypothetical protein